MYFLLTYYRTGRVSTITIKNDQKSDDFRKYSNVKLRLSGDKTNPKVTGKLAIDDDEVVIYSNDILIY